MKSFNPSLRLTKLSGLALLVGLTTASWAHNANAISGSYAVLLKNPLGTENLVEIYNSKGKFGVFNPGYGTEIDALILTAKRVEPNELQGVFGEALASMSEILAAGLPPLQHSYVALLESERGAVGSLRAEIPGTAVVLNQPSEAVLTNGYSNLPFQLEPEKLKADFGPALSSIDEILKAGFRAQSYVMLIPSPDGAVGKISIEDSRGTAMVEQAGNGVNLDPYTSEIKPYVVSKEESNDDFGDTLSAQPPVPVKYTLFFDYGGTTLTTESAQEADKMLAELGSRPAPEISIDGHTDAVGKSEFNDKLSLERAMAIADLISGKGIRPLEMAMQGLGKRELLVPTPDNKPEPKNRRAVINIR